MNRIKKLARKLQLFAVEPNVITTQQITVNPREVDFVTSFGNDLSALTEVLGIAQPIRKPNGAQLVGKTVTGTLESGDVPEGEIIPSSQFSVAPVSYDKISIRKYAKALTIETVIENGVETAVGMTDEEFKQQLIDVILGDMYNALLAGTLTSEETTWQMAVSMAIGRVKDKFKKMHKNATGVAVFVNTLDVYSYLGGAQITVQNAFGMDYVEKFLGADIMFFSSEVPQGRVIATPVNNMKVYYVDPGDSEFAQIGLAYTADPEVPYIGFHTEGNYRRAQSEDYAIMGIKIFFEYVDAVAVVTIANSPDLKTITVTPSAGTATGTTKATVSGNTGANLKYKLGAAAVPVEYGQNVRTWSNFTANADIPATAGQTLTVVEYDEYYKATGAGSAAVVVKPGE